MLITQEKNYENNYGELWKSNEKQPLKNTIEEGYPDWYSKYDDVDWKGL